MALAGWMRLGRGWCGGGWDVKRMLERGRRMLWIVGKMCRGKRHGERDRRCRERKLVWTVLQRW